MKYLEWLKKELGEEKFNKLFPQGSEILKAMEPLAEKKIIEDDGKLIPYSRFEELNTKKAELDAQLTKANDDLKKVQTDYDTLKNEKEGAKKTVDQQILDLNKKIEDLTSGLTQKDQQLQISGKRSMVESMFRSMKANEQYLPTLLREFEAKHPLDKLETVDGKIKDAETIFKPFQENFKPLFGETQRIGFPPAPPNLKDGELYTAEQLNSMSKDQLKQNWEKVEKSMNAISQNN